MRGWARLLPFALIASCAVPSLARADDANKPVADALFDAGKELLKGGQIDAACLKFEESQTADPTLGTMLRLADCYERAGRTASAWALFRKAAVTADALGEGPRADLARTRFAALEPIVPRIEVTVREDARAPGLEITVADVLVPETAWGLPLPMDPGVRVVRVAAPGRVTWMRTVELPKNVGHLEVVEVPPLDALPPNREDRENGVAAAESAAPTPNVGRTPLLAPQSGPKSAGAEIPSNSGGKRSDIVQRDTSASPGAAQRVAGIILGGFGLAGATAGGFLGLNAFLQNRASLKDCLPNDPTACSQAGVNERKSAQTSALASTVTVIASGATFAVGTIVFLAAPKNRASTAPRVGIRAGVNGASIEGAF